MKSPRHRANVRRGVGFRMLSKKAQERLIKYEYAVIWLLVLIAINSIVWSITLNILSGDFNNGIIGAKINFTKREEMDNRSREIFEKDFQIIKEIYTDAALEAKLIKTTDVDISKNINNKNQTELKTTENTTLNETTTEMPKKRIITHLFQIGKKIDDDKKDDDDDRDNNSTTTTTTKTPARLDVKTDLDFLKSNTIYLTTRSIEILHQSKSVQFLYNFPFLTEILAIIWTAMCLVFQSGVKKYWGLPKPWRIVVPSIFIFTSMTLGSLIYTIMANYYIKQFCTSLKSALSDPNVISCGQAMSVLRPIIKRHQFHHDVYLNLFRICYILSFLFWTIALIIVVTRYVLAIDFQLVDVHPNYRNQTKRRRSSESSAIKVKSPVKQQTAPKILRVDERSRHRSEDDFQSAISHISEVATPLLEKPSSQIQIVKSIVDK